MTDKKHLIDPGPSRKGWHRLQKVLRCPRLYALAYNKEKVISATAPAEPLVMGSALHIALAHHYALTQDEWKGREDELYSPEDAVDELARRQHKQHRKTWQEYSDKVKSVYFQYKTHWAMERWDTKAIEHELCVNIFDDERNETYLYTQRVDAIWIHPATQKVWFIDHKTTKRFTSRTVSGYSMSGQFLGYQMIGQEMFGDDWGGVLLNIIEWPKEEGGQASFDRVNLDPAPYSVEHFKKTIIHGERIIRDNANIEPALWPGAHHESACWHFRRCPHYETCQWGDYT